MSQNNGTMRYTYHAQMRPQPQYVLPETFHNICDSTLKLSKKWPWFKPCRSFYNRIRVTDISNDADWSIFVNNSDVAMDTFTWQHDWRSDLHSSKHPTGCLHLTAQPGVHNFHVRPWDIAMGGVRNSSCNATDFRSWFPAKVIIIFKTNSGI